MRQITHYCHLTYLLTYLLTHSVAQSISWEANWFAVSQEIPRISLNPNVHYRTHKPPPTVSILGQPNLVHIHTSHLLEIHPNIIHASTPRFPQWSLSLQFPIQDHIHTRLLIPYAPHAQPISFFSILSPIQFWVSSTNHLAPRNAISSIPPFPRPSITSLESKEETFWSHQLRHFLHFAEGAVASLVTNLG